MYDTWSLSLIRNANGWTVAIGGAQSMRDYYVFEGWEKTEKFIIDAMRGKRDALMRDAEKKVTE